jgi:hypothetical protein
MQSMAVFSSSTTMASMLRPRTTDTAASYFRWIGLQRSTTLPRTPIDTSFRPSLSGFVSKPLTWKDPLQASQSLLEASFTFRFVLVNAGLQKLLVDILKLLVYFRVQFPIHYVNADKDVSTEVAYAIFSLSAR